MRALFSILRPYRGRVALSILLSVGAIVGIVLVPLLVGAAVNGITDGSRSALLRAAAGLAVVAVLVAVSQMARQRVAGRISLDVEYDLRNRYFARLQAVEMSVLESQPVGQLVSRGTVDLKQIQNFLGSGISSLGQDLGTIALAAVVMFVLDADLAALALSPVLLIACTMVFYQRAAVPRLHEVRRRIGALAAIAEENITGVRLVRAFVREPIAISRFRRAAAGMLESALGVVRLEAFYTPTMTQLPTLGLLAVLLYGGHQALSGSITVGEFTSFYTYVLLLVDPASRIAYWMVELQQAIAGAQRINEVLCQAPESRAPDAAPLPRGPAPVSFEGAGFRYGDGAMVLEKIDLELPSRSAVAIVGTTGSGKSTLLSLINRLHVADAGVVEVAGRPTGEIELASLRRGTASAVDNDFLFSWSVRDNIAYGRPGASDDEVREAARRAQADEFIEALPGGYQTSVGGRGLGLSGGQRARIALARALLMEPQVLLLDNATGSLDARTEAATLSALARHLRECTTVMVAYRIPSLELADEVIVLDKGRIVGRGTHAQLVAAHGTYRELVGARDPGAS